MKMKMKQLKEQCYELSDRNSRKRMKRTEAYMFIEDCKNHLKIKKVSIKLGGRKGDKV